MLVEMADRILTPFDPPLSEKARAQLEELGVEVRTGVARRGDRRAAACSVGGEADRRRHRAVGRRRAAEPAGGGARRAARSRGPRHRRSRLRRARPPRAVRHRRHGGVHARGGADAAARHQPGRDAGGARRRAQHPARRRGLPRRPFHYFDKGFMATIGRARAVAQLGPAAHVWAARLAGLGVRPPLVPGRLSQPRGGVHQLDLGVRRSRATARASSPDVRRRGLPSRRRRQCAVIAAFSSEAMRSRRGAEVVRADRQQQAVVAERLHPAVRCERPGSRSCRQTRCTRTPRSATARCR